MNFRTTLATSLALIALGFMTGCNAVDDEMTDEQLGVGELAQVDLGRTASDWRLYTAEFANNQPFARILAVRNAVGSYSANTEYWYVNSGNSSYLGSQDLRFSFVEGTGTPDQQSGSQEFSTPALQTWQSFTSDPVSGGYLYDKNNIHLRVAVDTNGNITRLTWYQTIPSNQTPANVTPGGLFTVGSGDVSVPSGETGYAVDDSI